ncbi:MAG TPA: cation-translocating P-type ATPase [Myxococcales bacterium]
MRQTSGRPQEVADDAPVSAEPGDAGLSVAEALKRLRSQGPNRLVTPGRWAAVRQVLESVADPMALMLAAAGAVYLVAGEVRDGVILLAALVPVLGVDVALQLRSRRALRKLARATAARARVVRGGEELEVPAEDLVWGDLLLLREGDVLPADGVVRAATHLAVDESQLTGEAEPVEKAPRAGDAADAQEESRFYAGSLVLSGSGRGEVTATGVGTRYGAIARLVAESEPDQTPLQRKTGRLVRVLGVAAAAVAAGVFGLRMASGARASEALLAALAVAMAAVPEEFPLAFALFLSLGAWRLARRGVLVRRLASVETLGATTVICADKTGTLTRGTFDLDVLVPLEASETELLAAALLACEEKPEDPLERSILERVRRDGMSVPELRARWTLSRDYPFDPVGRHMTHVWHGADGAWVVVCKGALEGVLEHCRITPEQRQRAEAENARLAGEGVRVLAVARGRRTDPGVDRAAAEHALQFLGLLGFRDPLRPDVPAAIAECASAGIRVKLVTGDHPITAAAIARQAGIEVTEVLTGPELETLTNERRLEAVQRASVLARIRPEQKHAIVEALARSGEVVAMTGDGINDAPALRRADIGISLGIRGTEVARSAADLVLLRDDFAAFVATVREGRRIFDNLQRSFLYLIAFHVPIVGLALLAPLLQLPLLLLPVHLVWLELIVHPIAMLLFEAEPAATDVMRRPPRDPRAGLLPRAAALRSVATGLSLTVVSMALFGAHLPAGEEHARAVALAALISGDLLLVFAEHAPSARPGPVLPRTGTFWIIWVAAAATLPLVLYLPALSRALRCAPLGAMDWLLALGAAAVAVGWRALRTRASQGAARSR